MKKDTNTMSNATMTILNKAVKDYHSGNPSWDGTIKKECSVSYMHNLLKSKEYELSFKMIREISTYLESIKQNG